MAVDFSRLNNFLSLSKSAENRLKNVFEITEKSKVKTPKQRLNLTDVAQQYQLLLDNGTCTTRADLARHFGVSRVWITTVMKHLPDGTNG
jgi:hypothetical protein